MRFVVRILTPLTAVALLGACSSSSSTSSPSGNSPATSSSASSPASTGNSADTAAVTQVWQSFFSKNTPISQKETLLENGTTTMKPAVQAFAADPRVGQASATVQKVTFPSATEAVVTYEISLNGQVVLSGMSGKAVKANGSWMVAATTLCGLLQLASGGSGSSAALPGCS